MKGAYIRKPRPKRYCSIFDCNRLHYARDFCHNHYKRDEAFRNGYPYLYENRIEVAPGYAEVILEDKNHNEVGRALIDLDDVDMIRSFKWCRTDTGYAITNYYGTMIRMHVMIMGSIGNDHKNHNRLDNRRQNLRPANYQENQRNNSKRINKTGYRGVSLVKGKFMARVTADIDFHVFIGLFKTAEEAGYVYDQFAMQLFDDFAHTNFTY